MNLLGKIQGQQTSVGLDIGNHSLKLVKLRHTKDGHFLEATGIKELPPGTIEGSEIKKRDALIDAITTLINQCDPSIIEVVISMSGHGIISDKFLFKIDENENAEELILWEAGQRSPFDVDDITLDYKILHRYPDTNEIEVLLVAAKNQVMQNYIDLLYDAGLKPVIVDVDAFAITNCYALECAGLPDTGTVALLNIGHDLTNVTFIKDGIYHSTRDISTAGEFFNRTLQRNLGLSSEEALLAIKGRTTTNLDMNVLRQSVEYAAEELSSGIDLAFSYYKSSEKSDTIDKIVLSGGGAYIPSLISFLEKRHQTTVQVANPLSYLEYNPELFGSVEPQNISALLTVAVGLALRKVAE
ncbi:type IV pilus assembly protein PilM [Chitinispirillales bacterium ANBcel5]|uniref:type IV pilus assembly protein PilM n=1 Tax=Cellulosispirillum alkaliphilum TaxID=3039283 RepID=UPI002A5916D4|nr:type IV pilus assembly protein PilM [Chitinispirillales bacterium ANBcel5]